MSLSNAQMGQLVANRRTALGIAARHLDRPDVVYADDVRVARVVGLADLLLPWLNADLPDEAAS